MDGLDGLPAIDPVIGSPPPRATGRGQVVEVGDRLGQRQTVQFWSDVAFEDGVKDVAAGSGVLLIEDCTRKDVISA